MFAANNRRAGRENGAIGTVRDVDRRRSAMTVIMPDGKAQRLDLNQAADRRIRAGWVQTVHSAQGSTSDRVMAHLESFRTNLVTSPLAYVALSRARKHAAIYTNDREELVEALDERDSTNSAALPSGDIKEFALARERATAAMGL